jgi:hypothetical protein
MSTMHTQHAMASPRKGQVVSSYQGGQLVVAMYTRDQFKDSVRCPIVEVSRRLIRQQ